MRRVLTTAALGCLILIAAPGCGQREALQFNNAISGANKRLETAGMSFGRLLGESLKNNMQVDARLTNAYDDIVKTFNSVQSDMKGLKVPDKPSAKTFYDAHQKFLANQERMIKVDFKEIIDTMNSKQPVGARRQRIEQILQRVERQEKADLPVVQNAQRAFAADYSIRLQ